MLWDFFVIEELSEAVEGGKIHSKAPASEYVFT